jgi:hypothetical protein
MARSPIGRVPRNCAAHGSSDFLPWSTPEHSLSSLDLDSFYYLTRVDRVSLAVGKSSLVLRCVSFSVELQLPVAQQLKPTQTGI